MKVCVLMQLKQNESQLKGASGRSKDKIVQEERNVPCEEEEELDVGRGRDPESHVCM